MSARLIVTRPARDAQRWVSELLRHGVPSEALPLIEIAPLDDARPLQQAWQTLESQAALMFVSANAVSGFFASNVAGVPASWAQAAINTIADDLRFMAPGPGTVAALRAVGVPEKQIDAPSADAGQFDSETLWQVIGSRDWRGRKVLVVRGDNTGVGDTAGGNTAPGRDWLARQWENAGAKVDFLSVYQRRAPQLTSTQMQLVLEASRDGSVWLFSSSDAVRNLLGLAPLDWSRARAIATHPRIADTLRAAGFGVVLPSRPDLHDIRSAWASIESDAP